jgi:predicted nucleic acid-binding protein
VESWDGYIVKLARSIGNSIVYTLDEELRKIKDIIVVNPFPQDLVKQYHQYIKRKLHRNIK